MLSATVLHYMINYEKRRRGMIDNSNLDQLTLEISNHWSSYGLDQWAKPIPQRKQLTWTYKTIQMRKPVKDGHKNHRKCYLMAHDIDDL